MLLPRDKRGAARYPRFTVGRHSPPAATEMIDLLADPILLITRQLAHGRSSERHSTTAKSVCYDHELVDCGSTDPVCLRTAPGLLTYKQGGRRLAGPK